MKHPRSSQHHSIIMPHNFDIGAPVLENNFVIGPPMDISPASMMKPTNRKKICSTIFSDVSNHENTFHQNDFVVGPPPPPPPAYHHNDFVVGPPPIDDIPPPMRRKPLSRKKLCDAPTTSFDVSSNKRRRRTRKTVDWGSIKCYASSVTQNDINRMWYNERELKAFKEERRRVVQAIKSVRGDLSALEGTEYVTRGFECYQSIKFNRTIREQRKVVIDCVLRTQHKQRLCCGHDPEEIAFICRRRSSWARSWATDLGMKDASSILFTQEVEERTPELVKE